MTQLTEGMSYDRYMQLYTVAYNYCTSSRMINTGANDPLGGVGARCEYHLSFDSIDPPFLRIDLQGIEIDWISTDWEIPFDQLEGEVSSY